MLMSNVIDLECAYVYTLNDPDDNAVRYVGCTGNPITRYSQHLKQEDNTEKYAWVKSLAAEGKRPVMRIVCIVERSDAEDMETLWIRRHIQKGADLFNKSKTVDISIPWMKEEDGGYKPRLQLVLEGNSIGTFSSIEELGIHLIQNSKDITKEMTSSFMDSRTESVELTDPFS